MNALSRRDFMIALLAGAASLGRGRPLAAFAQGAPAERIPGLLTAPEADFIFGRVFYRGGDWNTDMLTAGLEGGSEVNLLKRVVAETAIETQPRETVIKLSEPLAFTVPFLYMTGHGGILLTETEVKNLSNLLHAGAFLFAEACNGKGPGFDENFRALMQRVLPGESLQILPMNHPLFRCYYQIEEIQGGDKLLDPFLEGIEMDGRLAVLYTANDLGCAWEGHPCRPGGEEQRDHAFRLGINIIVYALTH